MDIEIKPDLVLGVNSHYYSRLDIDGFTDMMKDPSFCYKFYWLEAIVNLICEETEVTTFDDLIDEMIANAWFTVTEFHIHLSSVIKGEICDGLERAVRKLETLAKDELNSQSSKPEVKDVIKKYNAGIRSEKTQLTAMVPYRALAGFFNNADHKTPLKWSSAPWMTEYIRQFNASHNKLPYTLGDKSRLQKEVLFDKDWAQMIKDNAPTILGWIKFEKIKWLQMINPDVPNLVYKLVPGDKVRKLDRVRKLWNGIIEINNDPILDVFNHKPMVKDAFDIDHFIPWTFVMNDELWNLMPMDSSLNSQKNNNLPNWELFFGGFVDNQFLMYEMTRTSKHDQIRKLFDDCYKDNLHSIWAINELYNVDHKKSEFAHILEKNMHPIYESAKRQGYREWKYGA